MTTPGPALVLRGVGLDRGGRALLDDVDWEVRADERWVVLGANGSGKTTLLRVAGLMVHPSRGEVQVLGGTLGRVDVRTLRSRIGVASQALADQLRPGLAAVDVVMTARYGALEPWWHTYTDADRERAHLLLDRFGVAGLAERLFGTLSSGERQRVQLARTLMADPELLLLDEPTAGLDIGAREDLVGRLAGLAADPDSPPAVLVTHHVEEIPDGYTHVLVLRHGRVLAGGPIGPTLSADLLAETFGLPLRLEHAAGRWRAWPR